MDARAALRDHFGHPDFRRGQAEAVDAALEGRDALVVMPTGSGKSLCYQLPALMRPDLTLVVSPLVSLMQDQVESLEAIAPGQVALVNAQRSAVENRDVLARAVSGNLRLLYVAPERFASPGFVGELARASIGLFVVDEAHCVSQWGHDFRPDYFRLADAARYLESRAIMALTATATPQVADDVVKRLRLAEPVRVATGFDRPNLSFAVVPCTGKTDKHRRIASALTPPEARPAIVYAGTRAGCETLARDLENELGEPVEAYHAGLARDSRAEAQRRFMTGETAVVVATNAFGMGVDKADVRTVCHETVPSSVEAFYQEAGRAGRDGAPAKCLLFAEQRDKGLHVFFIQRSAIDEAGFAKVAQRLMGRAEDGRYDLSLAELGPAAGGGEENARAIVGHLARAGVVRPAPSAPDRAVGRVVGEWNGQALAACRASAGEGERIRWRQYRAVWSFVEGRTCRRRSILKHFGDPAEPSPLPGVPCCDVCDPSLVPAAPVVSGAERGRPRAAGPPGAVGDLDEAIREVVEAASPSVGRTRAVEILRGGRSKVVKEHSYDGLRPYGTFAHLSGNEVLARVDALIDSGTLRSTGGRFPKLQAA
ncbi:MAG: RecQ family ATP-dependent DNA helicase [Solirubrobacteraceae bacterium]